MIENQSFGQVIDALKQGKRASRKIWDISGAFVFERPADELDIKFIVNVVKSLPQSVKDFFKNKDVQEFPSEQGLTKIKFTSYFCMYVADDLIINGWIPSHSDTTSDDWQILD